MLLYIVLGVFIFLLVIYTFFTVKYSNKFKLIFLFGKKGSGKSTLLVKYMHKYAKKGFAVYTNMSDCMFPGARIISIDDIGDFVPPPYSLLCLDEVGISYDARKFKQFKDSTRDFYKLQRHYKVLVVMTSQTWDVDKKVRDLCDLFYAISAIGPFSIGKQIRRKSVLTQASSDSESRIADNLAFTAPTAWQYTWLPKWRKYFDSFVAPERPYLNYVQVPLVVEEGKRKRKLSKTKRFSGIFRRK